MMAYPIKVTFCALLFYVLYVLLLERENIHRFKRIYLLASLFFSMTIPFATLPVNILQMSTKIETVYSGWDSIFEVADKQPLSVEVATQVGEISAVSHINYSLLFLFVYTLLTLLFLFRLLRNCTKMLASGRKNACMDYHGARISLINEKSVPHSFGRYIFINREDYNNGRVPDEIIVHEWTHVKQRHTYDIVFIELLIAFGWFNPVFYLYRSKIRQNHEFLADGAVIDGNKELIPAYQTILINYFQQKKHIFFTSNFNFNYLIIKKRIVMMTKTTSKKRVWCTSIALIPVFIAAIFVFSTNAIAQNDQKTLQTNESAVNPVTDNGRMIALGKGVSQELLTEYQKIDVASLEIIALYLPDSVIFKPVEGKEVKILEVSLVSKTDTVRAREIGAIATVTGTGTARKTSTVSGTNAVSTTNLPPKTAILVSKTATVPTVQPSTTVSETDAVVVSETDASMTITSTGAVRKTTTVSQPVAVVAETDTSITITSTGVARKTTTVSQPVTVVAETDTSITITSTGVVRKTTTVSATNAVPTTTIAPKKDNVLTYTNITIKTLKYVARKFNPPVNFEPQKIKIVVDGNVMFYDIVQAKWE